ncbi:hypothetical protein CUU62_18775 [Pseudomonas sp. WP001]|nr:hypothetical protein CUU62_18775 [Pseudomonas sp. WP001]
MLAKNSQAPRSFRKHALSLTFFASKLAPTQTGSRPSPLPPSEMQPRQAAEYHGHATGRVRHALEPFLAREQGNRRQ